VFIMVSLTPHHHPISQKGCGIPPVYTIPHFITTKSKQHGKDFSSETYYH